MIQAYIKKNFFVVSYRAWITKTAPIEIYSYPVAYVMWEWAKKIHYKPSLINSFISIVLNVEIETQIRNYLDLTTDELMREHDRNPHACPRLTHTVLDLIEKHATRF